MPPPAVPASKSPSPVATRHKRTKSATSPPNSPRQLANALTTRPKTSAEQPSILNFIAATAISLALSTGLRYAASTYTTFGRAELAAISSPAHSQDAYYVGGLLVWRIVVLAVYWFRGYDAYDVASLSILTAMPVALLEVFFYKITPSVLAIDTLSGLISSAAPFALLRAVAPAHHPSDKSTKHAVRNRPILTDPYTTAFTSLLAATILAVLLELGFETFLPTFLISNFEHIRTLEPAHHGSAQLPILLITLLPAGVACRSFLFAPSTSAPTGEMVELDTRTAGLLAHVQWNVWGWYSSRQKELIGRATVLAALMAAETMVQCTGALDGVDLPGAAGYAGVWVFGVAVVTAVLDWVGKPSE